METEVPRRKAMRVAKTPQKSAGRVRVRAEVEDCPVAGQGRVQRSKGHGLPRHGLGEHGSPFGWLGGEDQPLRFLAQCKSLTPAKVRVRPLRNDLLVELSKREVVSRGHIVIPDTIECATREGRVVVIGAGRVRPDEAVASEIMVGDRVLFNRSAGAPVTIDEDGYVILRQDEVLGVME